MRHAQSALCGPTPPKRPRSAKTPSGAPFRHSPSLGESAQPLQFDSAEEVVRANIRSPADIVQVIRDNPHLGFLYMTSAVPKSSIKYDAYILK